MRLPPLSLSPSVPPYSSTLEASSPCRLARVDGSDVDGKTGAEAADASLDCGRHSMLVLLVVNLVVWWSVRLSCC